MKWEEHTINDWPHFMRVVGEFIATNEAFTTTAVFRGQSDAEWSLKPTLLRPFTRGNPNAGDILSVEAKLAKRFRALAHSHLSGAMLDEVVRAGPDNAAIMQHYGAPTRLLDWTCSPYVAAYFACASGIEKDGVVWGFHVSSLNTEQVKAAQATATVDASSWQDFFGPLPDRQVVVFDSSIKGEREIAQQGAYTVCRDVTADHATTIEECAADMPRGTTLFKLRICHCMKLNFLRQLRVMNVTPAALFPGLDGVGKELAMIAQLAANPVTKPLRAGV